MRIKPSHATALYARCRRAAAKRRRLSIPVVGVSGTAGKTTTKEMLRRILAYSHRVVATPANRNADPSLPILAAGPKTRVIVAEVGMDRPGMIAWECRIIRPTVGIILNIGRAHAEACGGFMGVVRAKNELVHGLAPGGTLILNADDAGSRLLNLSGFDGRVIRFGRADGSDYRLVESAPAGLGHAFTVAAEGGIHGFTLRAPGEHLVYDGLAALAAARALSVSWADIRRGLARHVPVSGRQALRRGIRGSLIIDDSYNANPLSVVAGLKTLRELARGREKIAVLGNMEEQGSGWRPVHRGVGRAVVEAGVDRLVTVGGKAAEIAAGALASGMARSQVRTLATGGGAIRYLRRTVRSGNIMLVKGSHTAGLGRVVRALSVGRVRSTDGGASHQAHGEAETSRDEPHTAEQRRPFLDRMLQLARRH